MNLYLMSKKYLIVGLILIYTATCILPIAAQNMDISSLTTINKNCLNILTNKLRTYSTNRDFFVLHLTNTNLILGPIPPYTPKNPHPEDNATNVPINSHLSWIGGDPDLGDIVTYDVYLGKTLPIQKVASNISIPTYNPGILADNRTYMWSIIAWDNHSLHTHGPLWRFTTSSTTNYPPMKPNQPIGQPNGITEYEYTYSTITIDPDGDQVLYYLWDWGDGNSSGWLGPYDSKVRCEAKHTWTEKGNYSIKVKAKDLYNFESDWSDPLPITMPYPFKDPIGQFLKILYQSLFKQFLEIWQLLKH